MHAWNKLSILRISHIFTQKNFKKKFFKVTFKNVEKKKGYPSRIYVSYPPDKVEPYYEYMNDNKGFDWLRILDEKNWKKIRGDLEAPLGKL